MSMRTLGTMAFGGILTCGMVVLGGCNWGPAAYKRQITTNVAHVSGTPISVSTANGAVSVSRQTRQDVLIIADAAAVTQERADAITVLAEREPDGTLKVSVAWPDGKRMPSEGVSFTISLPDANGVTVKTSNGRITTEGMGGKADLDTSNGRVVVNGHAGPVRADSSNGRIELTAVAGPIDADTSNGSITIMGVEQGPVKADTSNGKIDVTLGDACAGPLTLDSSNGSVTVRLGRAFAGTLSARTSNSGVKVEGNAANRIDRNRRSATVVVGQGGEPSTVSTSNGSVTIELADAPRKTATPTPPEPPAPAQAASDPSKPTVGTGTVTPGR